MPIKYKLILSVYSTFFVVILLASGFIISQEIKHQHDELIAEAKILNRLLSQDFVALVALGEVDRAADITSKLRALKKVQGVIIYDKKRQPVFYYKAYKLEVLLTPPADWSLQQEFYKNSLLLFERLSYQGGEFGYIFIQLSAKKINQTIQDKVEQAVIILFALLLASLCLAWLIQRYFTNPIQKLANTFIEAAENHDHSIRLEIDRNDEIGKLIQGFNYFQNQIAEEKQAVQNLQYAFDQHNIVGITDVKGRITYANNLFVEISGYSKKELIGKNHRILNSSFHPRAFFEDMYKDIAAGKVWHGYICNKAKDGHEFWVATTIVPVMGSDSKPSSYIAIRTDVTEQNRVKENLMLAQKMVHIGSWELDLISNKLHWSDEMYRILEVNAGELNITRDVFVAVVHPDDRELLSNAYSGSLKQGQPYELEYRLLMQDGRIKNVKEKGETFFSESEKPLRSIGVVHDITHSKQTEEALRRSQKMDAMGQLTGGIAHDFNNIMGIIMGNVELIELQGEPGENIGKRIDTIKKSAKRAVKLTKQLLIFSRRKAVQQMVLNINKLVTDMESLIVHSITPEIEVTYEFAENLWLTKIDPGDFQDSILNIVINARDAMSGSGYLKLESSNVYLDESFCSHNLGVQPGEYIQLVISDNGAGMSVEQKQHIFEPFYTTKTEGSGTGLGLAMVFSFVERSNGYINVLSDVGAGTEFKIYFPRVYEEIKRKIEVVDKKSELLQQGKGIILVVDDEKDLLELARDILESLGYIVLTASNGNEALQLLASNNKINLLFSDVVMPGGVNGFELADIVKEKYPQVKILLTSGFTQKLSSKNSESQYAKNLLSKPYSRYDLAKNIETLLV